MKNAELSAKNAEIQEEKTEENPKQSQNLEKEKVKEEEQKDEYKFPPDAISSFTVKAITVDQVVISCQKPDDNGSKILEYNLYDNQKNLITKSETHELVLSFKDDIAKCSRILFSGVYFLSFILSAKNSIGESKSPLVFNCLIRPFQKNDCLICGKEIPLNGDIIGELPQFTRFFEGKFSYAINTLFMRHSSLMILDGGMLVQWGYSIDSSELEVEPQKLAELVEEMVSTPFYPMKNHNNPILVSSISCGNDFSMILTTKGIFFFNF